MIGSKVAVGVPAALVDSLAVLFLRGVHFFSPSLPLPSTCILILARVVVLLIVVRKTLPMCRKIHGNRVLKVGIAYPGRQKGFVTVA